MIIFYNKKTGKIEGTIGGLVHSELQLKMWVGSKKDNARLIVEWKPIGKEVKEIIEDVVFEPTGVLENGEETFRKVVIGQEIVRKEFEPDIDQKTQKDIFRQLDRREVRIKDFKVDVITKNLVPIQV